jgi:hypothetical protein
MFADYKPALLMLDAKGMEQLVDDNLESDAAALLKPNDVLSAPRPVRDDGIAAATPRADLEIVFLAVPCHESNAAVVVDMCDASGDLCPLGGGEGVVDHIWNHSVGPVVPDRIRKFPLQFIQTLLT